MKKTIKALAIILVLVLCTSLFSACNDQNNQNIPGGDSTSGGNNTPPSGNITMPDAPISNPGEVVPPPVDARFADHLEVILDSVVIGVINPHNLASTGAPPNWAYRMIYNTLTNEDIYDSVLRPELATRWETDDYITYTFYLRDDVYFHNGDKFTANDVVYTCHASQTVGLGSESYDVWNQVESITAVNDYEVLMVLKSLDVDFVYKVGATWCSIVNGRAIAEDEIEGYYIGTGPYMIADFASRDHVSFVRNDNYWGELPITKTQTWRTIPEVSTRSIMLQNGEADMCFEVSEGDLQMFRADPEHFTIIPIPQNNPNALQFNTQDPITGDFNFRMAVAYAINKEEISLIANGDTAVAAPDGTIWGNFTTYRNPDIPAIEQNLDLARQYLDQSVYKGEELTILVATIPPLVRAAEVIQEQLSLIGVKVKINQMDIPSFMAATTWAESGYQMVVWTNLLGARTSDYRHCFYTGGGQNRMKFDNQELNELLDLEPTVPYGAEKESICHRMQEIVAEYIPAINIWYRILSVVTANGVSGMVLSWDGMRHNMTMMYKIID